MTKHKLVVIGNGMAGARAMEEIVARNPNDFEITVFGEEPHGNYNRILLSGVLGGSHAAADIFLNPLEWYRENDIELHTEARVAQIDRENKCVVAENGLRLSYDTLLIATGSRPFVPPLEGLKMPDGAYKPGVFTFRTLNDCERIAGYATKCERAAVLGGGLLGLEAARGLMTHGAQVHVVHLGPHLMETQLDSAAGKVLRGTLENVGVAVHLEKSTTQILGDDRVTGLAFKDGTTLDCDMVVISCGIRPNVELARDCGLAVERAIVVDDQMRCIDDAHIYAIGECAQHQGRVYGLVNPVWEQAQVVADHLTGHDPDAAYAGSRLATKLKVMGVELASMGATEAQEGDETVQFAEPKRGVYKKLIIRDDILIGAMLLGDNSKAAPLMQAFDRQTPLPEERLSLLFDFLPPAKTRESALLEMPDDARVCNCNGVSKGAIRKCVLAGTRSLKGVMDTTRAGTGCGSCKSLVKEIVEWACEGEVEVDAPPIVVAPVDEGHFLSPLELRKLADLADKCSAPMVKISAGENIDLVGASKQRLFAMMAASEAGT